MTIGKSAASFVVLALITAVVFPGSLGTAQDARAQGTAPMRVFEMRTYTTHDGKLEDLQTRFRNHTTKFFEKHGMTNVGYWVPRDQPNTLVYILAYPSREAAAKSWDGFRKDEGWVAVRTAPRPMVPSSPRFSRCLWTRPTSPV